LFKVYCSEVRLSTEILSRTFQKKRWLKSEKEKNTGELEEYGSGKCIFKKRGGFH